MAIDCKHKECKGFECHYWHTLHPAVYACVPYDEVYEKGLVPAHFPVPALPDSSIYWRLPKGSSAEAITYWWIVWDIAGKPKYHYLYWQYNS